MGRIYSNLKFLNFPDHLDALRNDRVSAPVHVRVKPINLCNHSCLYCAYRADQLQLGEGMREADRLPDKKMSELVEDFIDMGVKAVTFSGGGEPLLYKSLPKHIRRLAGAGIKVAALTNGSNLKGEMAKAFAENGSWVRVSIDAWDDESYSRVRGIKEGQFSRLLENLRGFLDRKGTCTLGVSFIVGHDNHTHIAEVCTLLKEIGVNHVKISAAIVSNEGQENNLYHRKIFSETSAQIKRAEALNDNNFNVINHYHEAEERFSKDYANCYFLTFLTVIGADQVVYSCQDKAYTAHGALGSIRERSFKAFWHSEENRMKLLSINPSQDCKHHCVAHAKNEVLNEIIGLESDHVFFV